MMIERDGRKGGDVCSIYHQTWLAGFNPAFDQYDRVAWEIEKLMRAAIIAKALPVYVEKNTQSKLLVIDPKEWDWRVLYGDSDAPPGPLGGFKVNEVDSEGDPTLLKISEFQEWFVATFNIDLWPAKIPHAINQMTHPLKSGWMIKKNADPLTKSEIAIFEIIQELWPNGIATHLITIE
jgi:hypothetical protein